MDRVLGVMKAYTTRVGEGPFPTEDDVIKKAQVVEQILDRVVPTWRELEVSTSNKRWENFIRLRQRHSILKVIDIGDYVAEILKPRNFLAHGTPELTAKGHVFEYQGKKWLFSEEVSLSLRKRIQDYRQKFEEIRTALSA